MTQAYRRAKVAERASFPHGPSVNYSWYLHSLNKDETEIGVWRLTFPWLLTGWQCWKESRFYGVNMSDHEFEIELVLTLWRRQSMVLCFLSMRFGMAALFRCNTDSMTSKIWDGRGSYTLGTSLGTPCSRPWPLHALVYGDC